MRKFFRNIFKGIFIGSVDSSQETDTLLDKLFTTPRVFLVTDVVPWRVYSSYFVSKKYCPIFIVFSRHIHDRWTRLLGHNVLTL